MQDLDLGPLKPQGIKVTNGKLLLCPKETSKIKNVKLKK